MPHRPLLLKAQGLMLAAQDALEQGENEKAAKYLEMALREVKESALAYH